jgi:hypothetical protein
MCGMICCAIIPCAESRTLEFYRTKGRDDLVERTFNQLKQRKLLEITMIAFISDNGLFTR